MERDLWSILASDFEIMYPGEKKMEDDDQRMQWLEDNVVKWEWDHRYGWRIFGLTDWKKTLRDAVDTARKVKCGA